MIENLTVLVVTDNLFFVPRIRDVASESGLVTYQTKTKIEFDRRCLENSVSHVIIDLESDQSIWREILGSIKDLDGFNPTLIAYGPHTETGLLDTAKNLGCETVLTKAAFMNRIVELLTHGKEPL